MKPKSLKITHDAYLGREIAESAWDDDHYRMVGLLGGRYRLRSLLSVGGFGVIYTGEDTRLYDKKILVKANKYPRNMFRVQRNKAVVPQVEKFRFRLEFERKMLLQAAKRSISGTPAILDEVVDFGLDLYGPHKDQDGELHHCTRKNEAGIELWTREPFIVLSFVSGSPLKAVIHHDRLRRNILGNAKQLILQIGRILKRFHDEEISNGNQISFVYQDLKPDNIMFTDEKDFVLIDFGGFAVRAGGRTLVQFAKTGTPGYQPPEFTDYAFPPEKIDQRADIFSLGATVYHLLAGSPPKVDANGCAAFEPDRLNQTPKKWREWIETAVRPNMEDRFSDMEKAIAAAHALPLK